MKTLLGACKEVRDLCRQKAAEFQIESGAMGKAHGRGIEWAGQKLADAIWDYEHAMFRMMRKIERDMKLVVEEHTWTTPEHCSVTRHTWVYDPDSDQRLACDLTGCDRGSRGDIHYEASELVSYYTKMLREEGIYVPCYSDWLEDCVWVAIKWPADLWAAFNDMPAEGLDKICDSPCVGG